jgi:cell shape-determining protein MreC
MCFCAVTKTATVAATFRMKWQGFLQDRRDGLATFSPAQVPDDAQKLIKKFNHEVCKDVSITPNDLHGRSASCNHIQVAERRLEELEQQKNALQKQQQQQQQLWKPSDELLLLLVFLAVVLAACSIGKSSCAA